MRTPTDDGTERARGGERTDMTAISEEPRTDLHETEMRYYALTIRRASEEQYESRVQLEDLRKHREQTKVRILLERSQDDPKALGANEALRSAAIERIYLDEHDGKLLDTQIVDVEREIAFRGIEIDYMRHMLRIEELAMKGQ